MKETSIQIVKHSTIENEASSGARKMLQSLEKREKTLIANNGLGIITKDIVQRSIYEKKDSVYDVLIKPLVVSSAIESEILYPGSGELSLLLSLSFISSLIKKQKTISGETKAISDDICKNLSTPFHKTDVQKIINTVTEDKEVSRIIKLAIKESGSSSKIFIEAIPRSESIVEVSNGYFIKHSASVETSCFFSKSKSWEKRNTRIIIIDGDIISVGDIHYLLESASKNKEPYMVIARSFSADVLNTIHSNVQKGIIDVIPVDIPFEQETANILVDIAAACNSDIVSVLKGDLISKSCSEPLPAVSKIAIHSKGIHIENATSDKRCKDLSINIKKRLVETEDFELKKMLSNRILSLTGSKTTIKIGKHLSSLNPTVFEDIDKILRTISSATSFGVLNRCDVIKYIKNQNICDDEKEILVCALRSFSRGHVFPSKSVSVSIKKSISTFNMIKNISCGLLAVR